MATGERAAVAPAQHEGPASGDIENTRHRDGGLDVVQKIGAVKTDAQDRPITPVVMKKVTIERK